MLPTMIVVAATRDRSLYVLAKVSLSGLFFDAKVRRIFAVERGMATTPNPRPIA